MEELHAAIAAHLRAHRRQLAETGERESAILNIWQDCCTMQRCTFCGVPVHDDDGGLYNAADMRAVRECRDHYTPL